MAPETLFDGTANTTSDVWSFGVTLWEIVTIGGSPYFQMRPEDMRKVLEDGFRMPNPDHCSEEMWVIYHFINSIKAIYRYLNSYKIMQDCWEYDPQDRPGFDLISYRLETLSKSKLVSTLNHFKVTCYLHFLFFWFLELHRSEIIWRSIIFTIRRHSTTLYCSMIIIHSSPHYHICHV